MFEDICWLLIIGGLLAMSYSILGWFGPVAIAGIGWLLWYNK